MQVHPTQLQTLILGKDESPATSTYFSSLTTMLMQTRQPTFRWLRLNEINPTNCTSSNVCEPINQSLKIIRLVPKLSHTFPSHIPPPLPITQHVKSPVPGFLVSLTPDDFTCRSEVRQLHALLSTSYCTSTRMSSLQPCLSHFTPGNLSIVNRLKLFIESSTR